MLNQSVYNGEDVIVTGGTRGIGKGISLKLHKEGYGVYALYKNRKKEAKDLELQRRTNAPLIAYQCDITDKIAIKDFLAA